MSVCSTDRVEQPTALPILARASQRLWLFRTNDALAVHLCWAFHPACPSDHTDARSRGNLLAEISSSRRWREVVSAASDPTVTSRASADRLLRTEPQVRLTTRWSHRTITRTSSLSRTYPFSLGHDELLIIPSPFWSVNACGCIGEKYEPTVLN